eukprot:749489-Amorphochlora_amoeboformis.AAC.3
MRDNLRDSPSIPKRIISHKFNPRGVSQGIPGSRQRVVGYHSPISDAFVQRKGIGGKRSGIMAETEGERKCKTKRYPVKFLVETKSSLCGGVYDKGQDVEIKSIKLFSRKAAEVWGGVGMASNTVHVEGPLWVAAVVDNIHRGGAGFYDVYVPSSANAESCKMANILF